MTLVPGLGPIPDGWPVRPARRVLARHRRSPRSHDQIVTAFRDGQVTLRSNRRVEGFTNAVEEIGYQHIEPGDLVVHSMDAFAGAIGVSDSPGKSSPVVHSYSVRNGDPRFIAYVLRTMANSGFIITLAKGIRERSTSFDAATLASLLMPFPDIAQQRRIADFLDAETYRLDQLIRLRQNQHELTKARFTARVDQVWATLADTYGIVPLKRLVRGLEQGWSPDAESRPAELNEWGVLKAGAVNGGIFDARQNKALPPSVEPRLRFEVRSGDLIMSRASGSPDLIGSIAQVGEVRPRLLLCDKLYRINTAPEAATSAFLRLMLTSTPVRDQIRAGISGGDGMANNLPSPLVMSLPVPNAPHDCQYSTVEDLVLVEQATHKFLNRMLRANELLKEKRHALITAAVTGQFDLTTGQDVGDRGL